MDNKIIRGCSSLDLGCGTGQKSIYLAKYGDFSEVIGVDISERAVAIAKQNAKKEATQCQFICADATEWSFVDDNKTFDFILDWASLHGIPVNRQAEYIKGINQHSEKGTLLLIRTFSSQDKGLEHFDLIRNSESFRHYVFTKEKLTMLFSDFRILMTNKSKLERSPKKEIFMIELLLEKS